MSRLLTKLEKNIQAVTSIILGFSACAIGLAVIPNPPIQTSSLPELPSFTFMIISVVLLTVGASRLSLRKRKGNDFGSDQSIRNVGILR